MPVARLAVCFVLALPLAAAEIPVRGRVVDDNDTPVGGARVTVRLAGGTPFAPVSVSSDPDGGFHITLPSSGDYLFSVERQGFYAVKDHALHVEAPQELTLQINAVREVFQSANVSETVSPVDISQALTQERLSGTEINDIPYANSHDLRSSMQLMPGTLLDPSGALHFAGGQENQVQYLLDGFDIGNPISGNFQTLLAVEGIRSVDLSTGLPSAQYGKGTAGVLEISPQTGTDSFSYTATDFIPGLSLQHGLRLGNWYPRLGVSGPIVKGHAWFSDMFESEYNQALITGLPAGQNTRSGWAGSNLAHAQVNLTPNHILFADFLANVDNEGRIGLAPLNPVSTTSSLHTQNYLGSVRDQAYFGHGLLVNFGYAHHHFSASQTPQGPNLYLFSPQGNGGNYFIDATQNAEREQGLIHAYLPKFQLAGSHQLEAGTDVDWLHYRADYRRTGYEVLGLSGRVLSQTTFGAPALFHLADVQASSYLLDTWRVSKSLQFNLGVREDWDRGVHALAWSPRVSGSWSPFRSAHTRISGGYAVTHDAVTLDLLGRPFDQTASTTAAGAPPALTAFSIGTTPLALPRAASWNASVDQQLFTNVFVTARYLRRRGNDGFVFVNQAAPNAPPTLLPLPGGVSGGDFQLTNLRRDDYDSVEISVHQTFSAQYEWSASFTHSRAISNALLDPSTSQSLDLLNALAPMPWDAPNRLLAWTYLPLPWKNWNVSVLADMRTGFPYTVRDQTGVVAGTVDSFRFPLHFDLNIAIERMVTLRGYRFALRGGMDNATDQANPTAVNNVVGSPQYRQFLGDEGRHFVVRIRFFGRAGAAR